ncbi:MAG: DUF692 domain-containing protein [Gammaproteobacteria bacterium]|nr:DUF692 domain-containing protein [Gammaproteobacteria bacterium]
MHKFLGCGLGLRSPYYQDILTQRPSVDFFEIISEDYMVDGGNPLYYLDKVRENYPIVMHGVSMSIAGTDPLNQDYLQKLKTLIQRVQPKWISDHCCWTGVDGKNMHDLLPVPYTKEAINHIASRIQLVQEFLGQQIAIENVSSYVNYKSSEYTEWEFLAELSKKTDCLLLLDINNVYVNSFNHNFDPLDFIAGIPVERVQQFHLAGHTNKGDVILDTHDAAIIGPVWKLFEVALKRFGKVSTLIERDDKFPPFSELLDELALVRKYVAA